MANVNAPFGFRSVRKIGGGTYTGMIEMFYLPATDANQLFIGDMVQSVQSADTIGLTGLREVTKLTVGGGHPVLGAICGFDVSYAPGGGLTPNLNIAYRPASTAYYVYVCTDPDMIYEAQAIGAGGVANNQLGLNGNVTFGAGGNTLNNFSGAGLDATAAATTANFQLRILEFSRRPNNAAGLNSVCNVIINNHEYTNTTGV